MTFTNLWNPFLASHQGLEIGLIMPTSVIHHLFLSGPTWLPAPSIYKLSFLFNNILFRGIKALYIKVIIKINDTYQASAVIF